MSADKDMSSRGCDLDNEEEIAELMKRFYSDIAQDEMLGPFFNDVAQVNWDEHVDHIGKFWCRMLFGAGDYRGNPLEAHMRIHMLSPIRNENFQHWLELFQENVDSGWEGPYAQEIKRKAVKIALVHSRMITGEPLDVLLHITDKK